MSYFFSRRDGFSASVNYCFIPIHRRVLRKYARLLHFFFLCFRVAGAVGDGGESAEDKEKNAEAERERLEAIREAEERRKEKHRKMEEEREKMRQEIRDKVK